MKKKIIIILSVFVCLLLILFALFHTAPVRGWVLSYIIKKIETSIGAGISIESLDYDLLHWKFTFNKVSLFKKEAPQFPPFLKADQVMINIPFPFPTRASLNLEQAEILQPEIRYMVQTDGDNNFPFQGKGEPPEALPPFFIKRLEIKNAHVVYDNSQEQVSADIPGIDVALHGAPQGKHHLEIVMQTSGSLRVKHRTIPVENFSLLGTLDHRKMVFRRCTLWSGADDLEMHGSLSMKNLAAPDIDISLRGHFHTREESFIPRVLTVPGGSVDGDLVFNASLHGPLAAPRIQLNVETRNFLLAEPVSTSITGTVHLSLYGYTLDGLEGNGDFLFTPPIQKPGAGKLLKKGPPLAGSLKLKTSPNGTASAQLQRLRLPGVTVDGSLKKKTTGLEGDLRIDIPDIRQNLHTLLALQPGPEAAEALQTALRNGISGNSLIQAKLKGPSDSPRVIVQIKSSLRLEKLKELEVFNLEGKISYHQGITRIDSFHLQQGQAHLHISGQVPPSSAKSPVSLHLRGEAIDPALIAAFFDRRLPINARTSFAAGVQIHRNTGPFIASVEQLEINTVNQVLKTRSPFRVSMTPGGISVDRLELTGPGTTLQVNGGIGFNQKGSLTLSPLSFDAGINCGLFQAFLPSLSAEGSLNINGQINGSLSEPVVTAQLQLTGGKVSLTPLPAPLENIHLDISLSGEPKKVDIHQLAFEWNGCKVSLTGQVLPTVSLTLTVRDISSRIIAPYLPEEWAENIKGSMGLDFNLLGDRPEVDRLTGSGSIHGFQAGIDGFHFRQTEPAILVLENEWLILDKFLLTGPESSLEANGQLQLSSPFSLQAALVGNIHARILSHFWEEALFSGSSRLNLQVKGDMENPELSGEIVFQDFGMQLEDYNLYLTRLNGTISWEKGEFHTPGPIKASLNGGPLEIVGGPDWTFRFQGAKLDYPPGLMCEAAGILTLAPLPLRYRLQGDIVLSRGVYKQRFDLSSQLYRYFRHSGARLPDTLDEESQDYVDFDINIRTEPSIQVDNNISKAEISAALKLTGTPMNPILAGRAFIKEGSEIYLGKNTFYIDRGTVNFINPLQLEPELDISARTRAGDTDIRLRLDGTPTALSASLSSTPPMPETQIIELLVSGKPKPAEGTSTSLLSDTRARVVTYLGSTLAGKVERSVRKTLGLDMVRIDGSLVASKENPGARLTMGHHLTPNLEVILSQSLAQSQDRTWIVNYNPISSINLQGARKDDNAYSVGALHEIQWGLKSKTRTRQKPPRPTPPPRIEKTIIKGDFKLPEQEIRKHLSLKKGKPFHFLQLQRDIRRIQNHFHRRQYLDVEINTQEEEKGKKTTVFIEINAGNPVYFEFQGAEIPGRIRQKIKQAWIKGRFEARRIDNLLQQLYSYFFKNKYYRAAIRVDSITDGDDKKRVIIHINKGPDFKELEFQYRGNHSIPARKITTLLKRPPVITWWLNQPQTAARHLEGWYRQQGFLLVKVGPPEIRWAESDRKVIIFVTIQEGPQFRVGNIEMQGNRFLDSPTLENHLPFKKGDTYLIRQVNTSALSIESLYAGKGFYNTHVVMKPNIRKADALVDLYFTIAEYPQFRIKEIRILGNNVTRAAVIRRRFAFKTGDIVDLKTLNKSRKQLYDTGAFQWVNIEVKPVEKEPTGDPEQPCIIEVEVKELKPYRFRYGLQWDTETSLGLTGEFTHANFTGRAQLLGTSFRLNSMERDMRIFSRLPHFPGSKGTTELFLFANRIKQTLSAAAIERTGVTLQQQWRLAQASLLSLSYTFEKYLSETRLHLGHLTASFTYDTRDNFLEASRGVSLSQGFQYAGKWLGSHVNYFRYLGQFNIYKRITSGLVWASSFHLGLGAALGQALLPGSERFFAGGGTTLRGFKYNRLGPLDPISYEPVGGEAMLLLREELRWKLLPRLGVVFFLDMGNVYPNISDFNPLDLRKAAGIGLRFLISGLVLRVDWGFKLDRQPGESLSEFFFSIGHSF